MTRFLVAVGLVALITYALARVLDWKYLAGG